MTRRDYVLLSSALREGIGVIQEKVCRDPESGSYAWAGYTAAVGALARGLGAANPRFDAGRFLKDCGI